MKNKKVIIISLIVISILTILLLLFLSQKGYIIINEYNGGKVLTNVKQTIKANKEYYIFEDNNKKYIYYKTEVSCYSPSSIEIKSIDIKRKEYNNDNKLVLEINVETEMTAGTIPEGMMIDGYDTDSRDITLEVNRDCQGLIVNGTECTKYNGGIIYDYKTNNYGYVNDEGNLVLPIEYKKIEYLNEDYLLINNGRKGISDRTGKILVECKYGSISNYEENKYKVFTEELNTLYPNGSSLYTKVGIIDVAGDILKGLFEIKNTPPLNSGYYVYKANNKYGIIDKDLNIIIEPKYDDIIIEQSRVTKEYYLVVSKDNKDAVMDFKENIIIHLKPNMSLIEIEEQYEEYLNSKSKTLN